jgi:hypothetical protein
MGIDTWVITPVMGYYLYALDGEKTPYYDSMTLFRQQVFGRWEEPFDEIRQRLNITKLRRVA